MTSTNGHNLSKKCFQIQVQPLPYHPSSRGFPTSAFLYYHTFFNISYHLLLIPFRTKLVTNGGASRLVIKTNIFQKTATCLLHGFAYFNVLRIMYYFVIEIRRTRIHQDPTFVFYIATSCMFSIALTVFLYIFWLKKNQIQALLDEVCHEVVKDGGVKGFCLKRETLVPVFFAFLSIFLSLSSLIKGRMGSVSEYLDSAKSSLLSEQPHPILEYILTGCILFGLLYMAILSHFVLIAFPDMACCAVSGIGKSCDKFLKDNPDLGVVELGAYITSLRAVVSNLNLITNPVIFVFVGNALTNLTSAVLEILDSADVGLRVAGCCYSTGFVVMILVAADGAKKVEKLSDYIYDRRDHPSYRDNVGTLALLSELDSNPIALKCFKFPVTHGFVVTILSTGLTYSIILLQFKVASAKTTGDARLSMHDF